MLISVAGSTGLGQVAGVSGSSPAALLTVVARQPDQQVVLLVPGHAATAARRQADLLTAARPDARVEVMISHHHALTLTLVAREILGATAWSAGTDEFVEAVRARLTSVRSLVWGPSVWRLRGTGSALGTRMRCLTGRQDPVVELGAPARIRPGFDGWGLRPRDRVYVSRLAPDLLLGQLGVHRPLLLDTAIEPHAPYAARSAHLLTVVPSEPVSSREPHEGEAA